MDVNYKHTDRLRICVAHTHENDYSTIMTKQKSTFLDIVPTDQSLEVECHALRGHILRGRSVQGAGDKPGDEW